MENKEVKNTNVNGEVNDVLNAYVKCCVSLGVVGSRRNPQKTISLILQNKSENIIKLVRTLHDNNDDERAFVSFLNYHLNNIFDKMQVGDKQELNVPVKFIYGVNDENGHSYYCAVVNIKNRRFMFNFATEENMILEDSLNCGNSNKVFLARLANKAKDGTLFYTPVSINWVQREYSVEDGLVDIE